MWGVCKMQRKTKPILGLFLFLFGIILVFTSRSGLTGQVVSSEETVEISSIFSIVLIIFGLTLLTFSFVQNRKDLNKVIRTKKFEETVRLYHQVAIEEAISRIGTNPANEEFLEYKNCNAIRTSKGGRVLFRKEGDKIILLDYLEPEKHY